MKLAVMGVDHFESHPHLFLGQLGYCLFTAPEVQPNTAVDPYPSIDHLIPRVARKRHKRLFTIPRRYVPNTAPVLRNIVDDPVNHVALCRDCHGKIDEGEVRKIKIFRQFGLVGLVETIALYPRATRHDLYRLQYFQWRTLFNLLAVAFQTVQNVPEQLLPMYHQTEDLVGRYLYRWESGHFDVRSQCSHDLSEKITCLMGCEIGSVRLHAH